MRILPALILLPFLAACASLTENQCRVGDWAGIGLNDGLNGRAPDYVSNHFDACSDIGITPNIAAWQAGREQGLLQYCTPQNAYNRGRDGRNFNAVCPASQRGALNHAFEWGAEYFEIEQEIQTLEDEISEIEHLIITTLSHPSLTPEEIMQLAFLNSNIRRNTRNIWRLERRQERYAVGPF